MRNPKRYKSGDRQIREDDLNNTNDQALSLAAFHAAPPLVINRTPSGLQLALDEHHFENVQIGITKKFPTLDYPVPPMLEPDKWDQELATDAGGPYEFPFQPVTRARRDRASSANKWVTENKRSNWDWVYNIAQAYVPENTVIIAQKINGLWWCNYALNVAKIIRFTTAYDSEYGAEIPCTVTRAIWGRHPGKKVKLVNADSWVFDAGATGWGYLDDQTVTFDVDFVKYFIGNVECLV